MKTEKSMKQKVKNKRAVFSLTFGLLAGLLVGPAASANSLTASLQASGVAIGSVAVGSAHLIEGGAKILAVSASVVGESVHLVLRDLSTGLQTSMTIVGRGVQSSLTWTGEILTPVAMASGTLLMGASEVVAFVPHAVFSPLFHAEPYEGQ
jgi:hypothetical protein